MLRCNVVAFHYSRLAETAAPARNRVSVEFNFAAVGIAAQMAYYICATS